MPKGMQAGGNVTPKSIVIFATTPVASSTGYTPANAGFQVILASSATATPFAGISGTYTRYNAIVGGINGAPSFVNPNDGYIAHAGENCPVFTTGEIAPLTISSVTPCTAGDLLTSDSSGHGLTTTTTGNYVIGQAMRTTPVSGDTYCMVSAPGTAHP